MRFLHDLDEKTKRNQMYSVTFEYIQSNVRNITAFLFSERNAPPTSSCGYMGLKANWSQCCPIWDWSRLLRPLICLVWWALVEVIQPLNLSAYLSNSWANTHSPSALGLIFKHLEKTGPSVYASIFPSHLHLILFCRLYAEQGLDPLLWQQDILNFLRINTVCFPAHSLQNSSGDPIG